MRYLILMIMLTTSFAATADSKKKVSYRKTQEVRFDGADVDGLARTPDGAYLQQKKGIKFLPLYKVDKTFDRDIKSSVDYVK